MSNKKMETFRLNTGHLIPAVGLGTVNHTSSDSEVSSAVMHALKVGYRHFDTAKFYGTEASLGNALSEAFRSGLVKRKEVFVTSKLWCDDNDPSAVVPALQTTLRTLQMDYMDLYLMHFPLRLRKGTKLPTGENDFLPFDMKGSWRAMEKCCRQLGLAKAIGVSNFSVKKLNDLLRYADVVPAVNQVEMHPVWQQKNLRDFCNAKGIHVSAWSPLGAPGTRYGTDEVISNPVVAEIARKHGKTPAQVALRWGLQNGASVLPKSYTPSRIAENFGIMNWRLDEREMNCIGTIGQRRTNTCSFFCNDSTSPFKTLNDLWDGEI